MVDKSNGNPTIDFLIRDNNELRNLAIDYIDGAITKDQLQRSIGYDPLDCRRHINNVWWFNRKHHRRVTEAQACPIDALHSSLTVEHVQAAFKRLGYAFDARQQDYAINLVAIRTGCKINAFADVFAVIYWYRGKRVIRCFDMTTTANINGLAVSTGHYPDIFELANYKGQYQTLCQRWSTTVTTINGSDMTKRQPYDLSNGERCCVAVATKLDKLYKIDVQGSLNQTVRCADDFAQIISLCSKHAQSFSNCFTYTILSIDDLGVDLQRKAIDRAKAIR